MAARTAHDFPDITLVPFSITNAAGFVHHMGVERSSSLWDNPRYLYSKVHWSQTCVPTSPKPSQETGDMTSQISSACCLHASVAPSHSTERIANLLTVSGNWRHQSRAMPLCPFQHPKHYTSRQTRPRQPRVDDNNPPQPQDAICRCPRRHEIAPKVSFRKWCIRVRCVGRIWMPACPVFAVIVR